MKKNRTESTVIEEVSSYISRGGEGELPAEVIREAKHHILDTLAAMVSGSALKPGQLARKFVETQGGAKEAQVVGSPLISSAINAALANGMMAHADETDDSHAPSGTHPGCAIVPAALSVAEREEVDGMSFLRGVVVGYDIGCRVTQALGTRNLSTMHRSSHSIGSIFGAAAAAASILGLKDELVRYVLSYTAQQTSGVLYWSRDVEHIEKAFVFAGMPARNGVSAAILVKSGFTGVQDPFSGENNFFEAFSPESKPELLVEGLRSHYEVAFTNIKKFSVGSPIQAALDALLILMEKNRFTSKDVKSVIARLPGGGARLVNNRDMPDINLQYILAVALLDGKLTFEAAHSYSRMNDPEVLEMKKLIELQEDPILSAGRPTRQGIVEVTTKDGTQLREHVVNVRGTAENPMTTKEIENKCQELLTPVLGEARTRELIDKISHLERVRNVRQLRPLLSVS